MRSFIVGLDPGEGSRLARLSSAIGFPIGVLPSLEVLGTELTRPGAGRALVLLADPSLTREASRLAAAHGEAAFVVVLADTIHPDDYKALVRTGAGEWVQWGSCDVELPEVVRRFATPIHGGTGGSIVTFAPSKGGVGNTSLVAEIGVLLSGQKAAGGLAASRIAVLDLNFQGGTLADTLAIEPRFDLAEIAGRPERLDEQLTEVFSSRYADKLDVFAPPPRPVMLDDIAPNLIFTFLDTIGPRYDLVLVDLPSPALGWTETLIDGSDAVVVTGIATVPGLRRLCDRLSQIDGLSGPARCLAVVNQAETDLMGRFVRRAEVDRLLGGRDNILVRRDCASMEMAANAGQPLMETAPDGRLGRDIRRVAKWIEAVAARPARLAKESAA